MARFSMGVNLVEIVSNIHTTSSSQDFMFIIPFPLLKNPKSLDLLDLCTPGSEGQAMPGWVPEPETIINLLVRCRYLQEDFNSRLQRFNNMIEPLQRETKGVNLMLKQLQVNDLDLDRPSGIHKRNILAPVGTLIGGLLNLATKQDVQDVINTVKGLRLTSQSVMSDVHNTKLFLTKLVETTNQRFNATYQSLSEMRSSMATLVRHSRRLTDSIRMAARAQELANSIILTLMDMVLRINAALTDMSAQLQFVRLWTEAIVLLHDNKLPPFLVPPAVLSTELKKLAKDPRIIQMGLQVLHKDHVGYFYSQPLTTTVVTDRTIYIHFSIPLGKVDSVMRILHADTFPIPLQPTQVTEKLQYEGYSELRLDKPYLAVTQSSMGFVEMSEGEFQNCLRSHHFSCRALTVLHNPPYESCLYSLYTEDYVTAANICDYRVYGGKPPTTIKQLSKGKYLVIAARQGVVVTCKNDRQTLAPAPFLVIELGCECTITTGETYMSPIMNDCNPRIDVKVGYAVNLMHLLAFDMVPSNRKAKELLALGNDTVVIRVPRLDSLPDFTDRMATDKSIGLSMMSAATELANRQTVLYGPDIEDITDDVDSMSWKMMAILLVIGLIISLLAGGEVVLGHYLKSLWVMVHIKKAQAVRIMTPAGVNVRPPTAEPSFEWVETDVLLFIANLGMLMILCAIAALGYYLIKAILKYKYDTCGKCYSRVILMCMDDKEAINLLVTTVPVALACVDRQSLPHPVVANIKKVGLCMARIEITWPAELILDSYGHVYRFILPQSLTLSGSQAFTLMRKWKRRNIEELGFAVRLHKGCYCSRQVAGPRSIPMISTLTNRRRMSNVSTMEGDITSMQSPDMRIRPVKSSIGVQARVMAADMGQQVARPTEPGAGARNLSVLTTDIDNVILSQEVPLLGVQTDTLPRQKRSRRQTESVSHTTEC